VRWKLKKTGEFDIWSFYNVLRGHSVVTFPCKGIWGGQGLLAGFLFLFGRQREGKHSLEITWGGEVIPLWIGIACVGVMGNQWTIFWSTVKGSIIGGALFLDHLGLLGFFLREYSIFWWGGGTGWGNSRLTFGIWHLCVWYGVFGGNKKIEGLRISKAQGFSFLPFL